MSIYVNNVLRIKRSASQQEKMQQIMHAGIFAGYKDILMASAIVGYNLKAYVPIKKAASDGVLMSFFNEKDYDIMDLIAYSYTKEQSIVKKDEKYEIFSSFANGGFPILMKKLNLNDNSEEISEEDAKKAQSRYYSLLLSGEFIPHEETVDDDDLFI